MLSISKMLEAIDDVLLKWIDVLCSVAAFLSCASAATAPSGGPPSGRGLDTATVRSVCSNGESICGLCFFIELEIITLIITIDGMISIFYSKDCYHQVSHHKETINQKWYGINCRDEEPLRIEVLLPAKSESPETNRYYHLT